MMAAMFLVARLVGGSGLGAPPPPATAVDRPETEDSATVRVEVEGITGELERNVRAVMELARAASDGKIPRSQIERLYQRAETDIRVALEPFGYYRPSIDKSLHREEDRWTARYLIDPGSPIRIRTVSLTLAGPGAEAPEFKAMAARFPVHQGDTLRHYRYEAGKLALLGVAADSGYLDATFDSSAVAVDRDAGLADVTVRFSTGPRFRFGPVRFEQTVLDESLLRTRVPFKQGEPWRQDRVDQLQASLAEDPYFSRVEVMPIRSEAIDLEVPIRVVLEPRRALAYEVGAGYGTDTGPRGRATGSFRRINRRGHTAEAEAIVATRQQSFSATYRIPAVGHPTGTLLIQAGYARVDPLTSTSNTLTAGARLLRRRIGWREAVSLVYQRESFIVGVDSGVSNLLIAGAGWDRTRTNDRIYPTRGLRTKLDLKGSLAGLVGRSSFFQIRATAKTVYGVGPNLRLLARVELGHTATKAFHDLPPTLRFFAGGDQSVRGYDYQEIGPRDSLGNVVGGPALAVGSIELDLRVLPRWAVAAFADGGNATTGLNLDNITQSAGLGIRFLAPVGVVRLDLAFGLSQPRSPFRLHVSIGPDL
jgi:translocation and assembly module TamA